MLNAHEIEAKSSGNRQNFLRGAPPRTPPGHNALDPLFAVAGVFAAVFGSTTRELCRL